MLNVNARLVTPKLVSICREVFDGDDVYVTHTESEGMKACKEVVREGYHTVVVMGGDGTMAKIVEGLVDGVHATRGSDGGAEGVVDSLPNIAYVPMGTGNGLGGVVGLKGKRWKRKLRRARKGLENIKETLKTGPPSTVSVPILRVRYSSSPPSSNLCFFCGCGFDALMLNDFISIKKWSQKTGVLPGPLGSIPGYCVALAFKTLPKGITRMHEVKVRVRAPEGQDTEWIDHRRGDFATNVGGGTLFEGTTGILAASTVPFYGGGMKLFPFARITPNGMHLRLGRMSPVIGAINIPGVFKGWYRDKTDKQTILDFRGEEFDVEFLGEGRKPVQHSGEGVGGKEGFNIKCVGDVKFWDWEGERVKVDN